jgi:hypothetical protein
MSKKPRKPGDGDKTGGGDYEVGYGKPPVHTRFRKGQSGNAGGRGRRKRTSISDIVVKEAYRPVTVKQGDRTEKIPAIEAILRSLVARAATGNGRAQETILEALEKIEQECAKEVAAEADITDRVRSMSDNEIARRIAFGLLRVALNAKAQSAATTATENEESSDDD